MDSAGNLSRRCTPQESSDLADDHTNFIRERCAFQRSLYDQFTPESDGASAPSAEEPEYADLGSASAGSGSAEVAYMARFAHPWPAHPLFLGSQASPDGDDVLASGHSGVPLVCVVLKETESYRHGLHQALRKLAAHGVGLTVTFKPDVAVDQAGQHLLFAMVALRAPDAAGGLGPQSQTLLPLEDGLTRAEQRQIVWSAVHEALSAADGGLVEVVEEVFMVQDIWLYKRLYKWLGKQGSKLDGHGPLGLLFQEELDLMVHEYGEETASYFLFVNFYTRHLRGAAIIAMLCIVTTLLGKSGCLGDWRVVENYKRSVLLVFLPTWGFYFLASWRSESFKAGFRWHGSLGSVQNSVREMARLQALESSSERRWRYLRVLRASVPLMVLQLIIVTVTVVAFVCIEIYIYDVMWEQVETWGRIAAFIVYNLAFGIAFVLMLALFHPVSKAVTRWERHPDKDTEMWHMTSKVYANWFLAVFIYFFVIAFCYIPFGDNIADFISEVVPDGGSQGSSSGHHSFVRRALQQFHPEIHRLAVDVALFFVLQDAVRLMQVLVPVGRAVWRVHKLKNVRGNKIRNRRTEIFVRTIRSACSDACRSVFCCRRRGQQGSSRGLAAPKGAADGGAFSPLVGGEAPPDPSAAREEVRVLYLLIQEVSVARNEREDFFGGEEVVSIRARLEPGSGDGGGGGETESQGVRPRLRLCLPPQQRGAASEEKSGDFLRELPGTPMDLITLTCDTRMVTSDGGQSSVSLDLQAELLEGTQVNRGGLKKFSGNRLSDMGSIEVSTSGPAVSGERKEGLVTLRYVVGVVSAPTHHEALEKVPQAIQLATSGGAGAAADVATLPPLKDANAAGRQASGRLPWLWWDEELAVTYYDEVFELFAVEESFETFELYGHVSTQFSYVCLFSIAVPVCPLLAYFFTAIEVRQDQLRLLWLSRPPHPDESGKFRRTVSLGAWYTIIRFTAHMSVVVNLLLWGLTYSGFGSTEPAEWSEAECWRAIAIFSVFQQVCFWFGGVLHRNVSQLEQGTAAAYMRRYQRLQDAMQLHRELEGTPLVLKLTKREDSIEGNLAQRFVRSASQGVSNML